MVLQKQLIQLPFKGLQTKLDPKMAALGSYEVVDNMSMYRYPELQKRDGTQIIAENSTPTNIVSSYSTDKEFGVISDNSLYSYSESLDEFIPKGFISCPIVTSNSIFSNNQTQSQCNSAISENGFQLSAFLTGTDNEAMGLAIVVKDIATNTTVFFHQSSDLNNIDASSTDVKCIAVGTKIGIVFYGNSDSSLDLYILVYDTLTRTLVRDSEISPYHKTVPQGSIVGSSNFDAIPFFNRILVVFAAASTGKIYAVYWDVNINAAGTPGTGSPAQTQIFNTLTIVGNPEICAISINKDLESTYFSAAVIANVDATTKIATTTFNSQFDQFTSITYCGVGIPGIKFNVTLCVDEEYNTYLFYQFISASNPFTTNKVKIQNNTTSPSIVYEQSLCYYMRIRSKAFFYKTNAHLLLIFRNDPLQQTFFGLRDDGYIFSKFFSSYAGDGDLDYNLTNMNLLPDDADSFIGVFTRVTSLLQDTSGISTFSSIFSEKIFFSPSSIDTKYFSGTVNFAGGYLKQYDEDQVIFEQGYHLYPTGLVLTSTSVEGGMLGAGTYSYIVVWEWKDNNGDLVRSTPSAPKTITTTSEGNAVRVQVIPLVVTSKIYSPSSGYSRTNPTMAVYRTLNNGTTYYKVNPNQSENVYTQPQLSLIEYFDHRSDSQIQSNPLLYTTGGVFANICMPSCNLVCVAKNRLVASGSDVDPYRIWFSKEKEEGISVEFSSELSIIVDAFGGPITAIAAMDDKIIIFKETLIYFVAGTGPDKVGNGSFTTPQLISSDCGCNDPQSIVLMGSGIMFLSPKGIYLCDRQLTVTYIGQPVDAITTRQPEFQINSAMNLPISNQVYFTTNNKQILAYDTFFNLWSTQTFPFETISSSVLRDTFYVTSRNVACRTVKNLPVDMSNISIQSKLRTTWISLAQLEGFVRMYAILLVGDNANLAHTLLVNLYYDFQAFPSETLTIVPDALMTTYGSQSPYGEEAVYGGLYDGTYVFMIRPKIQKCTALKIEIMDQFPQGVPTQSFKFSGLSLVAGVKYSWNRLLSYQRRLR